MEVGFRLDNESAVTGVHHEGLSVQRWNLTVAPIKFVFPTVVGTAPL